MGYKTKDIAIITEPKRVSLSALTNFVQFQSKPRTRSAYSATVQINAFTPEWTAGKMYNNVGALVAAPNNNVKAASAIDVTAYQGLAYHFTGNAGTGWVVMLNAAGGVVASYQVTTAANIPATAVKLLITNNFASVAVPHFILDVSSIDFLALSWATASVLNITEPSGAVHAFHGTENRAQVGGSTYFVSGDKSDTAENLRQALLSDVWVEANFDIKIPSVWNGSALSNGRVLSIVSKGYGAEFNITLAAPNNAGNSAYSIVIVNAVSQNGDSISGEASTTEISLDVYTDAPIFLGVDDKPTTSALLGNFAVTLSKTYSGDALWFDVNGPFAKSNSFNLPQNVPGWFNTGTLRVYRFVARVAGVNNYVFYVSNALYVLKGYSVASDPIDLEDYVFLNTPVKLLTNKPRTNYVKGQREYINFMFSDADRGQPFIDNWSMYILYRAYDTVGNYLGQMQSDTITRAALNMVNTCPLRIDDVLTAFPTAGIIRVAIARNNALMSTELEYNIRPASLHTLRQFTFLNRLGGWDTFNFDAAPSEEVKVAFDTYTKTVTPAYRKGDGIETVYAAQLEDTLTIVGAPVTDEVAEWLKELAASTVVLDSDGNYIIKQEFTTPISDGAKNMQVPTMKYRTSETYTNE